VSHDVDKALEPITEKEMSDTDRYRLAHAVGNLETAMGTVLSLAQELECGMSDTFCDKYPFTSSLDEVHFAVVLWHAELQARRKQLL
jgi:hypothetical protein